MTHRLVVLAVLAVSLVSGVHAIRACASQISNPFFDLVREQKFGPWIQCDYLRDEGGGVFAGKYCFYYTNYTLAHYPDTPLRADSSPDCPKTLPQASTYLFKTSSSGKCITATSTANGAPVTIQDCDYRHGNPGQRWSLVGAQIRASDTKCLDVRDGSTANGAKLQIWACGSTNANQRFAHSGGDVLTIPDDRISWATHPGKCVDLTGGRLSNGNQLQMWNCGANNPNQLWFVAVTR